MVVLVPFVPFAGGHKSKFSSMAKTVLYSIFECDTSVIPTSNSIFFFTYGDTSVRYEECFWVMKTRALKQPNKLSFFNIQSLRVTKLMFCLYMLALIYFHLMFLVFIALVLSIGVFHLYLASVLHCFEIKGKHAFITLGYKRMGPLLLRVVLVVP